MIMKYKIYTFCWSSAMKLIFVSVLWQSKRDRVWQTKFQCHQTRSWLWILSEYFGWVAERVLVTQKSRECSQTERVYQLCLTNITRIWMTNEIRYILSGELMTILILLMLQCWMSCIGTIPRMPQRGEQHVSTILLW